MLKNAVCFCLSALLISVAFSDEPTPPARPKSALFQRVDPKLLREAMALPEYEGPPTASAPLVLEDLKHLAEKLNKNGDHDGADLLQRFILEHQRLKNQLQSRAVASVEKSELILKIVDVNLDEIGNNIILFSDKNPLPGKSVADYYRAMDAELERLISVKQAKAFIEPALRVRSDGNIRHLPAEEFNIPLHSGAVNLQFREHGIMIEAIPTMGPDNSLQLKSTCEFSKQQTDSGVTQTKVQSTFEMKLGEIAIQASDVVNRHKVFVIYKFVPQI